MKDYQRLPFKSYSSFLTRILFWYKLHNESIEDEKLVYSPLDTFKPPPLLI